MHSRISCLSESFTARWDATVSHSLPVSSISLIEPTTSGGIFLFSFTYWSNWSVNDLARPLIAVSLESIFSSMVSTSAIRNSVFSVYWLIEARLIPSTKTLTVPSGNFNNCRTFAIVPNSKRSSFFGSSVEALFWVISIIFLFLPITSSRALTDLSLPTNNGTTICGNTTMSLSGKTGSVWESNLFSISKY